MKSALPQFLQEVGITKVEVKKHLFFCSGGLSPDRRAMFVNSQGDSITRLVTFIHEYLHARYPEWEEAFVMAEERKVLVMLDIKEELERIEKVS